MKPALFALLFIICCQSVRADETNLTLTVSGITYSNVVFGRITPYAVSIRHSTGIASIPLAQLPPDLQKRFGYDPKKAADYHQQDRAMQTAAVGQSEERRAFDTINFGDSAETVRNKLAASTKVQPWIKNDIMVQEGVFDGEYELQIADRSYRLWFDFFNDHLHRLSFRNFTAWNASFFDSNVKHDWENLRAVASEKYGAPSTSKGYPSILAMQDGYSIATDVWTTRTKTVRLGISENDAVFRAELLLIDADLEAQKEAYENKASQGARKAASEGF